MIVRRSALKHGVSEHGGIEAASWPVLAAALDDENPGRQLRLGFDSGGRLLELVVLVRDEGTEELIHAMKARPQYTRVQD
ncbi:hypothetical protein CQ040_20210 [Microbacterium sp. MYb54]|nr:hypothetical protein CQ032_20155 [Microbacterium sp. MYb43]PQZ69242.1 hypothetical protein CQ031_20105 [Microbacterium sp. MYb40]PRB13972.1 hypothetical protein CQ040_20210 [Microbacterium sp. MYb54]PRB20051.1 hypothetical protein CQ037_20100 [Microbacterium sp. MYb50]PRB57800.1 hypothetical protein CQ021_20185 [Microbacterium sp. MYb24]PRB64293.1 hypothetical protein CQ027_20195 [Microbacterium sp. MYb32]